MTISVTAFTGSETVSTTEWSMTTDTAGPDNDTTVGIFQAFIDVSAVAAGDVFEFKVYEKARAADTQRLMLTATIANAQAFPLYVTDKFMLGAGWDMTLKKISGTDRAITWSIRSDDGGLATDAALATAQTSINDLANVVDALPSGAVLGVRFDTVDAAGVDTLTSISSLGEDIDAAIAALNNLSAAAVKAEVVGALATDTYAEPTGVPAATDDLATKIGWLFMALRNQVTATATKKTFYDDGGAAEWEKDLSDDGTTYTETEANAI